MGTVVS
jgi:hypothetical protein